MSKIYYIDNNGMPQTADLSIIDTDTGCHCEGDILGNMDIPGCGNVHHVPDDVDDCESEIERAALAAKATYYADDQEAAQWWIDYVSGYNATQDECDALRDELREMDGDMLDAIAAKYLGDELYGKLHAGDEPDVIIEALHGDYVDYGDERGAFVSNMADLRAVIDEIVSHDN